MSIVNIVRVDDWTAERAIIASNISLQKQNFLSIESQLWTSNENGLRRNQSIYSKRELRN